MNGSALLRSVRPIAAAIFILWLIAGVAIFMMPVTFYALTPGVRLFGPFNAHFIRDVALVYLASGVVGLYGLRTADKPLCIAAAGWSCLHAVFHLHMWVERGYPCDGIFLFDLAFVIAPPFLVASLVWLAGVRRADQQ